MRLTICRQALAPSSSPCSNSSSARMAAKIGASNACCLMVSLAQAQSSHWLSTTAGLNVIGISDSAVGYRVSPIAVRIR